MAARRAPPDIFAGPPRAAAAARPLPIVSNPAELVAAAPSRPPLVWRSRQASAAVAEKSGAAHPAEPSPPPAASPGQSTPALRQAAGSAGSAATPLALEIDHRTAERLADDVMRRIERRMRVERERRGI